MNLGRLTSLKEAIFGTPQKPAEINKGVAVLGTVEQVYGTSPPVTFQSQMDVYMKDPVVHESILQSAQEIISTGIFTTYNEDYTTSLPTGPNKRSWTAKEAIDYWNKQNNTDQNILQEAVELIAFGNSFWNITDGGFRNIPIEAIQRVLPINKDTPLREKYNLELTGQFKSKIVNYGDFIHMHTEPVGNGPLGMGIIYGMIAEPDTTTPSLYTIRKAVRASMKEGFEKFSFGNEMWIFEGMSDEQITELGEKITEMSSTGQRIVCNVKGDIKLAVPQRTQSYDKWIEQIHFEFLMALANPSLKLGLEQGFTKATAEAAKELYEMKVASMRRIIKRHNESVWTKVLDKLGFDGEKAEMRLNFGSPEISYTIGDVFAAKDKAIISAEEARAILTKYMKWELTGEAPKPEAELNR